MRIAELEDIENVQEEVILMEKEVKVTKDLGMAAGHIEVVIRSRSRAENRRRQAEGGRGWETRVWRWQQGFVQLILSKLPIFPIGNASCQRVQCL